MRILEGELLIRTQSTTIHQIFSEAVLNSKVIFKNIIGPDDTWPEIFMEIFEGEMLIRY